MGGGGCGSDCVGGVAGGSSCNLVCQREELKSCTYWWAAVEVHLGVGACEYVRLDMPAPVADEHNVWAGQGKHLQAVWPFERLLCNYPLAPWQTVC